VCTLGVTQKISLASVHDRNTGIREGLDAAVSEAAGTFMKILASNQASALLSMVWPWLAHSRVEIGHFEDECLYQTRQVFRDSSKIRSIHGSESGNENHRTREDRMNGRL
jgi:hypothetical protein